MVKKVWLTYFYVVLQSGVVLLMALRQADVDLADYWFYGLLLFLVNLMPMAHLANHITDETYKLTHPEEEKADK